MDPLWRGVPVRGVIAQLTEKVLTPAKQVLVIIDTASVPPACCNGYPGLVAADFYPVLSVFVLDALLA
jgi:hypothetical protein